MRHTLGSYVTGPYLMLHQRIYQKTGGAIGRHALGRPTLLLHTLGRKTGEPRCNALVYAKDADDFVVVASYGGAPQQPAWFLNLQATPTIKVQVGRDVLPARARVAEGDERDRLWKLVNDKNRGLARFFHRGAVGRYDVYQLHTEREIPVVTLTPA